MKRILFAIVVLCALSVACEKETVPQLSQIDMSGEQDGKMYVYYRFVNMTGVPIHIAFLPPSIDIGICSSIDNERDYVVVAESSDKFYKPEEYIFELAVYYNPALPGVKMTYYEPTPGGPMSLSSWKEEVVDANSVIRAYTFTPEHYEDAKINGTPMGE